MRKYWIFCMAVFLAAGIMPLGGVKSEPAEYDVVVIGAGGGGLGAAAMLSRHGVKVLVVEQHDKVGGYMTAFERGDYRFEVSLHAIDGLDPGGMTRSTFTAAGILDKVKPIRLDPMYRAIYPEHDLVIPADPDKYKELLQREFPGEAEGIERLFATMGKINETFKSLILLMSGEYWAGLRNPGKFWPVLRYWDSTLSEMLSDYIHDQKLIAIFTQLAGYAGAEPDNVSAIFFSAMWCSYHFGGYYYFEGGSQAVSDALAEVIRENGGEIWLETLVTKIQVEKGKAVGVEVQKARPGPGEDPNIRQVRCRYVVSNANAPDTFFKLVGREHLPADYVRRLESLKIGRSAFNVYLGVDHDYTEIYHSMHQLMITESYDPHENFVYYDTGVPEKASFAIANYTAIDPGSAPPGKNVICITSMLPYDWKNDWYENESYEKYDQLKTDTAWIFIRRAEKYLPGLSEHIEVMEVGSPRTMEHYTLNPKGTIFGWDNTPEQSMFKRLKQETPIENLYLAGAWTFPGGGQSAVIASGLQAADLILKKDKKK